MISISENAVNVYINILNYENINYLWLLIFELQQN